MPSRRLSTPPLDFAAIRREFEVPEEFPPAALTEAEEAAASVALPAYDATALPLVTLDPVGSRDLDQAMHLARLGDGYRVSYAIADVSAFVRSGGALDEATAERGVTVYCPDLRVPLHPPVLSEGAASLLPDQVCPAVLWQIDLDAAGAVSTVDVRRAAVRSIAQLDYPAVQSTVDSGTAHESLALLPEIGALRLGLARQRHAIELNLPEQEVMVDESGSWSLVFRAQLPVEIWNAQISLLTGICAAQLMLAAGVGILRTLPEAPSGAVRRLRHLAPGLGVDWPESAHVGDVLAGLDPGQPRQAAFLEEAASLLRGAGYAPFDGAAPDDPVHAAVAAPYAHVTAPLRRLVDRFGTEVCLAQAAGTALPGWVRDRLPELPGQLVAGDRRSRAVERAALDLAEAHLLAERVGAVFDAVVAEAEDDRAKIVLSDLAVRATCDGAGLTAGEELPVRLTEADPTQRRVRFVPAGAVESPSRS